MNNTSNVKNLFVWERIVLGIVALLSFLTGISSSLIDAVMALAINTIILFIVFKIGNRVFRKE